MDIPTLCKHTVSDIGSRKSVTSSLFGCRARYWTLFIMCTFDSTHLQHYLNISLFIRLIKIMLNRSGIIF